MFVINHLINLMKLLASIDVIVNLRHLSVFPTMYSLGHPRGMRNDILHTEL